MKKKFSNLFISKLISVVTMFSLFVVMSGIWQLQIAYAAGYTAVKDVMSREMAATKSTHHVTFTLATNMVAGGTITINFPTFTGTPALSDIQICHGASTGMENGTAVVAGGTACTATSETLAASNGATTVWGGAWTGTSLVLTAPSGTPTYLPLATHIFNLFITNTNITNPAVSSPVITITGSNGDTGNFAVSIIDNDQVSITATVNSSITFDLDTATSDTNSVSPYSVALGAITTAAAVGSNESSINSIWVDLDTNATGGAIVTVQSANGALKSVATPAHTIPSATATMANGTANYGICAKLSTNLTKVAPFDGATCTTTATGNTVGAVTTSPQNIYTTGGAPVAGARGEIMVNAENSTSTIAHPDYADTLTFVATGTF